MLQFKNPFFATNFVVVNRQKVSWQSTLVDTLAPYRFLKRPKASKAFSDFPNSENCFFCTAAYYEHHYSSCPLIGGYLTSLLPSSAVTKTTIPTNDTFISRHRIIAKCWLCDNLSEGSQFAVYLSCGHTCCTICLRKTMWFTECRDFRRRCALCRTESTFICPLSTAEVSSGPYTECPRNYTVEKLGDVVGSVRLVDGLVHWESQPIEGGTDTAEMSPNKNVASPAADVNSHECTTVGGYNSGSNKSCTNAGTCTGDAGGSWYKGLLDTNDCIDVGEAIGIAMFKIRATEMSILWQN